MSSVRGGTPRGRPRGSSPAPARGRGSSTRGQFLNSNASRPPGASGGTSVKRPFRQTSDRGAQGHDEVNTNGFAPKLSTPGAFAMGSTKPNWQERYQVLLRARERERINAIQQGQIADPDRPRSLAEAVTPAGTCQEMCAEYERVQRVVQKDVWDEELDSTTSAFAATDKDPDEKRMVKKFRRAAAGLEEQLPSDLRPPKILKQTCDYLFNDVVGKAPDLAQVHHFVWDRTRAIRNDFSIQQVTKPEDLRLAIECYERIARFHIVSLHQLALPEKPYSKYDSQQEREQLDRTLLSLMQYYDDCRGRIDLPHEAEFRAYCVIFQLQDPTPDLEDRVQTWPKHIVRDLRVQKSVDLYMAACNVTDAQGPLKPRTTHLIARQDWQRFWVLVTSREVSYLMACVAEIYFNLVRRTVLNALFRTFRSSASHTTPDWTVDTLCDLLAFDDGDEVYTFCERYGFSFKEREDGEQYLDLTSVRGRTLPEPTTGMSKQSKSDLVESKRFGRTLPAVINGLSVKEAQDADLVTEDENDESMQDVTNGMETEERLESESTDPSRDLVDDEESLFVPEHTTSKALSVPVFAAAAANPWTQPSSVFGNASSTPSTFGKPSASNAPFSIFPRPQTQASANPGVFDGKAANTELTASKPTSTPFSPTRTAANINNTTSAQKPILSFGQPSSDTSSIFTKAAPPAATTIASFSFNQPQQHTFQPTSTTSPFKITPSVSTIDVAAAPQQPLQDSPKSQSLFTQPPVVPAAPTSSLTTQTDSKPYSPQQPTLTPAPPATTTPSLSASNLGPGAKRPSFSTDNKPKKPSPLSNSVTAIEEVKAVTSLSEDHAKHSKENTAAEQFKALVTRLADELCNDPDVGLFKQYIDYAVSRTVSMVYEDFTTEQSNKEADEWRRFTLHQKYGRRWRDAFWRSRLAKTGRERRERRQRRLREHGTGYSENSSIYGDGDVLSNSRQNSDSGGNLVDEKSQHGTYKFAGSNTQILVGAKRPMSSQGEDMPKARRDRTHKRLKSTSHVDDRGRIAKPEIASNAKTDLQRRSAFLDFSIAKHGGAARNTTMSNYFRHKALGLNKIDALTGVRGAKRLSGSYSADLHTSPPTVPSATRSTQTPEPASNRALMLPPSSTSSRASRINDEDEALFARLRAARESLRGGTRSSADPATLQQNGLTVSASSHSSADSPSMIQARMDARLRASSRLGYDRNDVSPRSVPAYRLRESRFVPREHYAKAIERAHEIRNSRSRDNSRPQSQLEQRDSDLLAETHDATQMADKLAPARIQAHAGQSSHLQEHDIVDAPSLEHAVTVLSSPSRTHSPTPVSFAHHTTQLSPTNPFLPVKTPTSLNSFASQSIPAFAAANQFASRPAFDTSLTIPESQDHTINPAQIGQSLARSFGSHSAPSWNAFGSAPQPDHNLVQQDSYLYSDDGDLQFDDQNGIPESAAVHRSYGSRHDPEEMLYDGSDLEYDNQEPETAFSSHKAPTGLDDDVSDSQSLVGHANRFDSWQNARDGYEGASDDYGSEDHANGYYEDDEDADERADDADIGEEETDGDDDDTEVDDDDEEAEHGYAGGVYQQRHVQWPPQPVVNPVLQDGGNTAEEAIELSD